MSPKARSTVKPLHLDPDASPQEQTYVRGLHAGMSRKVYRIKQEIATREALTQKLVKKIGLRNKRIAELEANRDALADALQEALAEIAYWLPDYLEGGRFFEHPRGSGPDRVMKLGQRALSAANSETKAQQDSGSANSTDTAPKAGST